MSSIGIKVVLFTDCDFVRAAIRGMGLHTTRYQLVDHVSEPDDLKRSIVQIEPDLVVFHAAVDIQSVMSWSARLRQFRSLRSGGQTIFVLLTDVQSDVSYLGAYEMGADAYIAIDQKIEDVRATITKVSTEGSFWSEREVAETRARCGSCEVTQKVMGLEQIDRQILKLVTDGLSDKEIAVRVFMAHQTVRNHVSALLATFKVRNRTELAILCQRAYHGNNTSAA
jgi:two-component system response regulator DevR